MSFEMPLWREAERDFCRREIASTCVHCGESVNRYGECQRCRQEGMEALGGGDAEQPVSPTPILSIGPSGIGGPYQNEW